MDSQLTLKQIELKNNKLFTTIILCSTVLSMLNFTANYYLIKSLNLNPNSNKNDILIGLSSVIFKNNAQIDSNLRAKVIDGSKFDLLTLRNENSINLKSKNGSSHLKLGNNTIEIQTKDFRIQNQDERTGKKVDVFRLKDDELFVRNVDNIHVNKQGGLDIVNSLDTPSIAGSFSNDLELSSLTKSIEINSKNDLSLNSKYSQMNLDALRDLNINGRTKIVLDSKHIQLKNLNRNRITNSKESESHKMFKQVCACQNGRMFAVAGNELCRDDETIC